MAVGGMPGRPIDGFDCICGERIFSRMRAPRKRELPIARALGKRRRGAAGGGRGRAGGLTRAGGARLERS